MTKPTHTADRSRPSAASGSLRRGVKALVSTRGAVLLVREEHDDGSAFWTLPQVRSLVGRHDRGRDRPSTAAD